jgi:hypothetical protein
MNYILRYIIIWLVKLRGNKTRTEEVRKNMFWIFFVTYLNTGPILLLINSDLRDSGIPFVGSLFKRGKYGDFSMGWYNDVG